jgi:hypothetical protein
MLALRGGNSGKLARRGPWDRAVAQRPVKMRQGFEGFGDAEALFGPAWTVAEDSLDVLSKACEAEVQVNVGAQGA